MAKNDAAHQGLSEQFAAHGRDGRMQRLYQALVWGEPLPAAGTVDAALARSANNRKKIAVSNSNEARHAVTHYRRLESFGANQVSLIECRLETGRTHQIRVHMAHIGHPVLGDKLYGTGMKSRAVHLTEAQKPHLMRSTGKHCTPPRLALSTRAPATRIFTKPRCRRFGLTSWKRWQSCLYEIHEQE